MTDTLHSIVVGGIAGIISGALAYFGTRSKLRLELEAEYEREIRRARLTAYEDLWKILEPLARYGRSELTRTVLRKLSDDTKTWYFRRGGIYLTQRSRKPYFLWKSLMEPALGHTGEDGFADLVPKDVAAAITEAASRLRTSLSDDIGTKELRLL